LLWANLDFWKSLTTVSKRIKRICLYLNADDEVHAIQEGLNIFTNLEAISFHFQSDCKFNKEIGLSANIK